MARGLRGQRSTRDAKAEKYRDDARILSDRRRLVCRATFATTFTDSILWETGPRKRDG